MQEQDRIVDLDVHLGDTPEKLAPYCDMPWRKSLEIMAKIPYRHLDVPGMSASLKTDPPMPGGHPKHHIIDAAQMVRELGEIGITDALLVPDNLLHFALIQNVEYALAMMRAYNRWMVAEWLNEDNGLWGAVMATPQDPVVAAAEIREYAKHSRIKAVYLPTAGIFPLWGARKYDPIMEAANETGLALILHSVSLVSSNFPHNTEQFENHFARQVITHPFSMMSNLVGLMHTGVPVRYPKLKIIFTEAGISWVPHMMWRLDRYGQEYRRQVPFFDENPSDYMKRQMWFATQPLEEPQNPQHLVEVINQCGGADRIVYASDWPHHDFDHPRAINRLPLKPDERRKIMYANAVGALNLPPLPVARQQKQAV